MGGRVKMAVDKAADQGLIEPQEPMAAAEIGPQAKVGQSIRSDTDDALAVGHQPAGGVLDGLQQFAHVFVIFQIGLLHCRKARHEINFSQGGRFDEHVIDEGIGTHEAKLIVLDGRVGIAGKPYRNMGSDAPRGPDVDCVNLWLPEED